MMGEDEAILELKSDIADMERMINEYLDFSKSGGTQREGTKDVDIKDFLENIVIYYQKMHKNISHKLDIKSGLEIPIKRSAMKRAIRNLIDNSFYYGDRIEISAQINKNTLKIIVDDNGCGIPESERGEIFKPFYRIDNSRNLDKTTTSGGAGLGLAIVMDVISSHDGRIKVEDSPLGGLRMAISLPI